MIEPDDMASRSPGHPDAVRDGVDLGHGVLGWIVGRDGISVGVMHEHPAAGVAGTPYPEGMMGGGRCGGYMPLAGRVADEGATWDVTAGDPDADGFQGLTLSPSSLCRSCGHHGFIQLGRWVPA